MARKGPIRLMKGLQIIMQKGKENPRSRQARRRATVAYEAMQAKLPAMTQSVVGDPITFLNRMLGGFEPYMELEFDHKAGNYVIPSSFVPKSYDMDASTHKMYEEFVSANRYKPLFMKRIAYVYDEIIAKATRHELDRAHLYASDPTVARGYHDHPAIWDDPTLAHRGFQRAVQFKTDAGTWTHYQMGTRLAPKTVAKAAPVQPVAPKTVTKAGPTFGPAEISHPTVLALPGT